eukprot:5089231-Prymnesium_polylepis.1
MAVTPPRETERRRSSTSILCAVGQLERQIGCVQYAGRVGSNPAAVTRGQSPRRLPACAAPSPCRLRAPPRPAILGRGHATLGRVHAILGRVYAT